MFAVQRSNGGFVVVERVGRVTQEVSTHSTWAAAAQVAKTLATSGQGRVVPAPRPQAQGDTLGGIPLWAYEEEARAVEADVHQQNFGGR